MSMSLPIPSASNIMRPVLPSRGTAIVKSVLSGDTVVLSGRAAIPGGKSPLVVFTFERVTAPRLASKSNGNVDDPGAFPAREWLRTLVTGKQVAFETRKQGASAGDRVYGLLFIPDPSNPNQKLNLAVEAVRLGHATPKIYDSSTDNNSNNTNTAIINGESSLSATTSTTPEDDPVLEYERALQAAYQDARATSAGIHASNPLVRSIKNAGDEFQTLELIEKTQKFCQGNSVLCVVEYIFDGSRVRLQVTDPDMATTGLLHSQFTLILAGVACPRVGNPRVDPPTVSEPFAEEAKEFVEARLLHRELKVSLYGTDKIGVCAVGTLHHPKGNIGLELLKNGLACVSDWSARMMNPLDIPAFRVAENNAKRTNIGVWHSYSPPEISGSSEIHGTVVEVLTGDTLSILPVGKNYDDESVLRKVSLASIRAPRVGNEAIGKADEPFAVECKDRLRVLTVGKNVKITIHYERDIPMGNSTEKRQFATIGTGKRDDVGEVLVAEGLATTQYHREGEEKSPNYDALVIAEGNAKAAKKGVHSDTSEIKKGAVNDLTDPKKAKAYSGSLMRAGFLKAVVEYVFNGNRFKLLVPSENCSIVFAIENLRSPQPTVVSSRGPSKKAEPFGDTAKFHSRLNVLQRSVEIKCKGVTNGGVITGELFVGGGAQRRDFGLELVGAGLATVDERKIEYGEAPKVLIEAQNRAMANKAGLWSLEQKQEQPVVKTTIKAKEEVATVRLSEIRSGSHFFFHVIGDKAASIIEEGMKLFTAEHGTYGAPCDLKAGKIVAALFDGSWYRAKLLEKKGMQVKVLYIDHGNVALVPISTHLRPLDASLGVERIPAVAKEATLAFTKTRSLEDDDGIDAAHLLQTQCWGKDLTARIFCEVEGKLVVSLYLPNRQGTFNEKLIADGLARVAKSSEVNEVSSKMLNSNSLVELVAELKVAEECARKTRSGMWRYGDVGDDDEDI